MEKNKIINAILKEFTASVKKADKKQLYDKFLKYIKDGTAILTAQEIHKDIPTIHNFAGKYHSSVDHVGYGMFTGKTEHGKFDFDAGGAMNHSEGVSWTTLNADKEVLHDLKYDFKKVEKAIEELMTSITASKNVTAGKKTYYRMDGIGKAKYTINFHDGVKKHKDGSDFYDIRIFHNKKDMEEFEQKLLNENYKYGPRPIYATDKNSANLSWGNATSLKELKQKFFNYIDGYISPEEWESAKRTIGELFIYLENHYIPKEEC